MGRDPFNQPPNQPVHINPKVRFSAPGSWSSSFVCLFVYIIPLEMIKSYKENTNLANVAGRCTFGLIDLWGDLCAPMMKYWILISVRI